MQDLKICLYNATFNAREDEKNARRKFGEWDFITIQVHAKFCALYTLIEDAGLEEDYQAWQAWKRSQVDDDQR